MVFLSIKQKQEQKQQSKQFGSFGKKEIVCSLVQVGEAQTSDRSQNSLGQEITVIVVVVVVVVI